MATLAVGVDRFPIAGAFTIARGSRTEAAVVTATLTDAQGRVGRGECVPYARYGETVDGVAAAIAALGPALADGLDRAALQTALPAGAARNALDCALWDLEAKRAGEPVWRLAGLAQPSPLLTAYTLSLGAPAAMAAAATAAAGRPLLKVKLGGGDGADPERLAAVRAAAPAARLIVDANEGWRAGDLASCLAACAAAGVELIEQPLPAGDDDALRGLAAPCAICADESAHDRSGLAALADRYQAVNVKLDKTGGLTEALATLAAARSLGLKAMVGCMLGSSLSMAPALLAAAAADWVDLDAPLLLAADRTPGLSYDGSFALPAPVGLWGD